MRVGLHLGMGPRRVGEASPPVGTAPGAFGPGNWSLATGAGPAEIVLTITALPGDGSSAITALHYSLNGGATWAALTGTGTGARSLTMAAEGTGYDIVIRARNAFGPGPASAPKSATSGAAASGFAPDAVAGLAGWYDAAHAGSVSLSGSTITQIANRVSSGPALLPTPQGAPGYTSGVPASNGRAAIIWPGAANNKGLSLTADLNAHDVFVVAAYKDGADSSFDAYSTLMSNKNGVATYSGATRVMGSLNSANLHGSAMPGDMVIRKNNGAADLAVLSMPLSVIHASRSAGFPVAAFGATNDNKADRAWRGVIAEILVYTSPVSAADRGLIVQYLTDKWAIA